MGYMSVKQAAEKWQLTEAQVTELCQDGTISGAILEGRSYFIPDEVKCPVASHEATARPSSPEYEALIDRIDEKISSWKETLADEVRCEAIRSEFIPVFVYEANAIEGNDLTLDETKTVLDGQVIAGKSLKSHLKVVGLRDALMRVCELASARKPLTEAVIKDIHSRLLLDLPNERGIYRKDPVYVAGAFHRAPEPDRVPGKMAKQLEKYTAPDRHPIENAVLYLMKFDGIHPFSDGNGRMGKLLLNYLLVQYGYPPVSIQPEDKRRYYDAMDSYYRDDDALPMMTLVAAAVEERLS